MKLDFKPIQPIHFPLAYSFLRDAFKISFGEDSKTWPNNLGNLLEANYSQIIEKKLSKDPSAIIHVWSKNEIAGQIESSIKKDEPECGYVSLYYLIPDMRRIGLGVQLDEFVTKRFKQLCCKRIELTVEPTNITALKFYEKQGWINKGLHPSYEEGILMEKWLV